MGASFETCYVAGDTSCEQAYQTATSDAYHEYGHDSYNGSITTTRGFRVVSIAALPLKVARRISSEFADGHGIDKWGQAGAIAVAGDEDFTRVTKKKTITTTRAAAWEIKADVIAEAQATCASGEWVEDVRITDEKVKWKVKATKTTGRIRTMYEVRKGAHPVARHEKRTDALTQAREMANAWLASGYGQKATEGFTGPQTFTVHAVCVTPEENGCIGAFTPELVQRKVTVEVTIAKAKRTTSRAGWLFCFWAAT